jgi:hypothetical protein
MKKLNPTRRTKMVKFGELFGELVRPGDDTNLIGDFVLLLKLDCAPEKWRGLRGQKSFGGARFIRRRRQLGGCGAGLSRKIWKI